MSWTIRMLPTTGFAANTYWLESDRGAWLIDPAANPPDQEYVKKLRGIIATHGHLDHLLAADQWRSGGQAGLHIHALDASMLTDSRANASATFGRPLTWRAAEILLQDHDRLELSPGWIRIVHTPGHTAGGICLLLHDAKQQPQALFTGDTLFADDVGRTDLSGGSEHQLMESLVRLRIMLQSLPPDLPVYPGHGPHATAQQVLKTNRWLIEAV